MNRWARRGRASTPPRRGAGLVRRFAVPLLAALLVLSSCQSNRISDTEGDGTGRCRIEPTSLDFGIVGTDTSAVDTFYVRNIGDGPLSGQVRQLCSGFTVTAGEGAYTLAPGQRRVVVVRFEPAGAESTECVVQVGGACGGVRVAGRGQSPALCQVSPTHLDFDTVTVGRETRELSFTIRNAGQARLNGAVGSACGDFLLMSADSTYSLGPDEETSFTVRFAPTAAGFRTCTIRTGTPCLDTVTLQGLGEAAPLCDFSSAEIDFGPVLAGTAVTRSLIVRNLGGGILAGDLRFSCPAFSLVSGDSGYRLGPDESKTFLLRFQPVAAESYTCTIEASTDCPALTLTGRGTLPPAGACCHPDGSCRFVTDEECDTDDWRMEQPCAPNPCPQPQGACCSPDGSCVFVEQAQCATGDWRLEVPCQPNPCPPPQGACCAHDGTCRFIEEAECSTGSWTRYVPCDPVNPCPQPEGACCYADGSCRVLLAAECETGDWRMDVACEPANPCAQPFGACCSPDGSCTYTEESSCLTGSWTLEVACDPQNPCPQPMGACCSPDGNCSLRTAAACAAPDAWSGMDTSCAPNLCPQPIPVGACCNLDTGACAVRTEEECEGQTYTHEWRGAGTSCVPNPCPVPSPRGACCSTDGSCLFVSEEDCSAGTWQTGVACAPYPCPLCEVLPDSTLSFGQVMVGSSRDLEFLVTNDGGSTLSGRIALSCSGFLITSGGGSFTVDPGYSHSVGVRFSPAQAGPAACTVELNTGLCPGVLLTGEGISPPLCAVSSPGLDFGTVVADGSAYADRGLSVRNDGGGILNGTVTENCADFAVVGEAGYSLASGESQEFTVRFRPQSGDFGSKDCTISAGEDCAVDVQGEAAVGFEAHILPHMATCAGCHSDGNLPDVRDYDVAVGEIDIYQPAQSRLLLYPSGQIPGHGDYEGWHIGETAYALVLLWIQYGVPR